MNPSPSNLDDDARRRGGRAMNAPESLALRISRAWPDLTDQQREVIGAILGPLVSATRYERVRMHYTGEEVEAVA
ncbi:MAG TPA: hypothetical protein VFC13_23080 [Actinomycetes bacterium]|jgi:hypothetical protein|nr:hypothetical protein [Actinomycetes bacterium]